MTDQTIKSIGSPEELAKLAKTLGVNDEWHEPDNQGVSARIRGNHLDNAMGSTMRDIGSDNESGEFNVVISHDDVEVAVVNLATLLAWAASIPERYTEAFEEGIEVASPASV
ncbi:hypothetical protein SEA_MAGRITTE_141 [Microbacterium phage Magritte]|nr:hypothetical protein SEA_MAGRITTE_141 [Microbacterium phage Magritte]